MQRSVLWKKQTQRGLPINKTQQEGKVGVILMHQLKILSVGHSTVTILWPRDKH